MGWSQKDFQRLMENKKAAGAPPGKRPVTTRRRRRTTLPPPGGNPPSPGAWGKREWWIEMAPITANRFLRLHWATKSRDLEKWRIALRALDMRGPWHPERRGEGREDYGPAKVKLHVIVLRTKLCDPDNAMATLKNPLDALRYEGWLYQDSPEWLDLRFEERKAQRKRTIISWTLAAPSPRDEGEKP